MPNQSLCGSREDFMMGDCNISLPYSCSKNEGKTCKYTYSTWCPTCERDSPRRRTKSETVEPCRRKGKEMKKADKNLENMDLEVRDVRYDRVRTNLCELPTSYIANNCQTRANVSSKLSNSSDFMDYFEKTAKNFEGNAKFADYSNHVQTMAEKSKNFKSTPVKITPLKSDCIQPHYPRGCHSERPKNPPKPKTTPLNVYRHERESLLTTYVDVCKQVSEYKFPAAKNNDKIFERPPLCFETCTYFDKTHDDSDLQARYNREIEMLRSKLRQLKGIKTKPVVEPFPVKEVVREQLPKIRSVETESRPLVAEKVEKNVEVPVKVENGRVNSGLKVSVSVKAKRKLTSSAQSATRRLKSKSVVRAKQVTSSSSGSSESDCSDSNETSEREESVEDTVEASTSDTSTESTSKADEKPQKHDRGDSKTTSWPLRKSLFPNVPPYVLFNVHDASTPYKLPPGGRYLKWKLSTITPIVVRKTLVNTGFRLVRKSNDWLGTWGKHMKSPIFRTLKETQKLNHFPGTFQIGRKDRLWRNFQRLIQKFGQKEFGFLPQTFVLPQDLKVLKQNWEFKSGGSEDKWIIKPPAAARGVGIKVINKWAHVPKRMAVVVQKYISNPYLINGSKFDLRLYVLVTSFNPLRIYLYPEGLVRFASAKYSGDAKDLKDRYMHLTNYSINKMSSQYTANEDANACQGHKWTLSKLWEYLGNQSVDTRHLWKTLQVLVIKTLIAGESPITQLCAECMNTPYNCYELFGVDVLLDEDLKPWLLEVNISPSLHSASPLDAHVKGPLVKSLFDMAQFHLPPRLGKLHKDVECFEPKVYATTLLKRERLKQTQFLRIENRDEYLTKILENLTGDDVRRLIRYEDELTVMGAFEKIFPTSATHKYLPYLECKYYNRLLDAWETKQERHRGPGIRLLQSLCQRKLHLKVAPPTSMEKNLSSMNLGLSPHQPKQDGEQEEAQKEEPLLAVNVLRPCQSEEKTSLTKQSMFYTPYAPTVTG